MTIAILLADLIVGWLDLRRWLHGCIVLAGIGIILIQTHNNRSRLYRVLELRGDVDWQPGRTGIRDFDPSCEVAAQTGAVGAGGDAGDLRRSWGSEANNDSGLVAGGPSEESGSRSELLIVTCCRNQFGVANSLFRGLLQCNQVFEHLVDAPLGMTCLSAHEVVAIQLCRPRIGVFGFVEGVGQVTAGAQGLDQFFESDGVGEIDVLKIDPVTDALRDRPFAIGRLSANGVG